MKYWIDGTEIQLKIDNSNDYDKEKNEETVSLLNEALNKIGIYVEMTENDYLLLKKSDAHLFKMTRCAGRRKRYLSKSIPLDEIEERIKNSSAQAVADELGISRSTLFRRIKEAKESLEDEIH